MDDIEFINNMIDTYELGTSWKRFIPFWISKRIVKVSDKKELERFIERWINDMKSKDFDVNDLEKRWNKVKKK